MLKNLNPRLALFTVSGALALLNSCGFEMTDPTPGNTSSLSFVGNLDAREPITQEPWDATDPSNTARISATVEVRDENRSSRQLSFFFRKEEPSTFDYHVLIDGANIDPAQVGQNVEVGHGRLNFNGEGALESSMALRVVRLHFAETKREQTILLDFGTALADGGDGKDGITQYALSTSINYHAPSN